MSEYGGVNPALGAYRQGAVIISRTYSHDDIRSSNNIITACLNRTKFQTSKQQSPPLSYNPPVLNSSTMPSSTTQQYIYITNLRGGQAIRADPNIFLPDDDEEQPSTTTRPAYPPRNASVSSTSSASSRLSSAEPSDQE